MLISLWQVTVTCNLGTGLNSLENVLQKYEEAMKKKLLCAALFVAGISSAHAEVTTWSFVYQGFVDAATGLFDPQVKFTGSFTGDDRNLDGVIAFDELSYFESQGITFLSDKAEPDFGGCGTPYLRCQVENFNYALTGNLDYTVATNGADEFGIYWWYSRADTGSFFHTGGGNVPSNLAWVNQYNWSDQTSFSISPAPVPEPAVALMLPAGLALMYLTRVRRRKISA